MRSYRKRQIIKIFKTARAKAKRFYPLLLDEYYNKKIECADRLQCRAFGSVMYHLHKNISKKVVKFLGG